MDFEALGAFYLGRPFDPEAGKVASETPVLYDARDLTTHAVVVGMTGSGKTGLSIGLLEEAAIDGVPAICIDPKGDLGNLLLTFPELKASQFEPWIDPGDAQRKGQTIPERAAAMAKLWKKGLGDWGQDGARIRKFEDAVERTLYTPGSKAGVPLAVLGSLGAPPPGLDDEALRERVEAATSGLLSLLGEDADVTSREHVFLSHVFLHHWRNGQALDLGGIVRAILEPPFARVGVLDLDTFYEPKARQKLALKLNSLLASPTFASWLEGEPLDIQRLLYTPEGKPRLSIISIAHLDDAARMFFVTLLLNELVSWMRSQPGTSSLRAILYMDEVFGFLPPIGEPPSKRLFLTLLKQARAFGLGLVLATQNPVDIDYKALSNCGSWFLGRLQTERDVDRVLDGLKGAATAAGKAFDASAIRATLAGLKSRVFLMNNVHEAEPILFHTRWVLSYLGGPLSRTQIQTLTAERSAAAPPAPVATGTRAPTKAVAAPAPGEVLPDGVSAERPTVAAELDEVFLGDPVGDFFYEPAYLATCELHYALARADVDHWETVTLLAPLEDDRNISETWAESEVVDLSSLRVRDEPENAKGWVDLPRGVTTKKRIASFQRGAKTHVSRSRKLVLGRCKALKLHAKADEPLDAFQARVQMAAREARDLEVSKVRARFDKKIERAEAKVRSAEAKVDKEKGQASRSTLNTAVSVGTTLLGVFFGSSSTGGHVRRAATAARRAGSMSEQRADVGRAEEGLRAAEDALAELRVEAQDALAEAAGGEPPPVDTVELRPRKSDLTVQRFTLAWVPVNAS